MNERVLQVNCRLLTCSQSIDAHDSDCSTDLGLVLPKLWSLISRFGSRTAESPFWFSEKHCQ